MPAKREIIYYMQLVEQGPALQTDCETFDQQMQLMESECAAETAWLRSLAARVNAGEVTALDAIFAAATYSSMRTHNSAERGYRRWQRRDAMRASSENETGPDECRDGCDLPRAHGGRCSNDPTDLRTELENGAEPDGPRAAHLRYQQ